MKKGALSLWEGPFGRRLRSAMTSSSRFSAQAELLSPASAGKEAKELGKEPAEAAEIGRHALSGV